ncbi:MAG TPA: transposase [Nitrosomonas nitrosa]|uniref:transposase n=1 Tax=Nitrosomonas sp. TaxID=42353 RepID=UPI002085CCAE|nr:transposase [Nitrosomonas sp.]GJL76405.1 MAG: transposase [Nitrosomonas sp.]HNP52160.1 transposase [Nitrosomonas nitrosa]
MPRKRRFYLPGVPVHVFQRGYNRQPVFFEDEDYLAYLRFLKASADALDCLVHAYVLMTNHVHLLVTPKTADSISLLFQSIGRHFVPYINKTYQRRGSLWEGRHKGNILESEDYFLICMRYIEMNPVRVAMVEHPAQYRWSSYAANALGVDNAIVRPHELYLALDKTPETRQAAYRALFETAIHAGELDLIRASLHSGTPLGNEHFKRQIESVVGSRVGFSKRGRPLNSKVH